MEVLSKDNTAVLFKLKAGQYFGEQSLLLGEPRAATVRLVLLLIFFKGAFAFPYGRSCIRCQQFSSLTILEHEKSRSLQKPQESTNISQRTFQSCWKFSKCQQGH